MRARLASIAFLIGSVSTCVAWMTLQPALVRLHEVLRRLSPDPGVLDQVERLRSLLPFAIALDLGIVTLLAYLVLHWSVERPLRLTEGTIEQVANFERDLTGLGDSRASPLLSRVQSALRRMGNALQQERALTQKQLTELQRAHSELLRTQTELVSSERLATVGRLAAGVAHEVGNPLSGILGYLSLCRSRLPQGHELHEFLKLTEAEVQRIDGIVRSLLDLGRTSRAQAVPLDVKRIVEGAVRLVGAGPELREVTVEVEVPEAFIAKGEAGPLSQILLNLLLNAGQAMGGKGHLRVRARGDIGDFVALEVEDDGPGIPEDALPHLFEPFFTTKEAGKGTGLGLAVSRHLASVMGGALSASNRAEGGARFTLRLPKG